MLERVHRFGPLPYAEVLQLALDEFYDAGGGRAGRDGADFVTSPEVGPLYGAVLGRALDSWWRAMGSPDPFVVVEAGAGAGTLARAILASSPRCASALRYVLVERSERLRGMQAGAGLPLEPPGWVLGPRVYSDDEEALVAQTSTGPMCASLAELPAQRIVGVVLANELLDNLPFVLMHRAEDCWEEVRVGERDGALVNWPVAADEGLVRQAERFAPDAPVGAYIPLQHAAQQWVASALSLLERGRLVVVDYADTTPSMARREPWSWCRTYRAHGPGTDPLSDLGLQDVTCEVAVDQLAAVRTLVADRSQAEFLAAHGISDLVAEAKAQWEAAAAAPDLGALAARSRVNEAAALTDPAGLGAFRVLEWTVG